MTSKYEIKRKVINRKNSLASLLKDFNRFEHLKPNFIDLSSTSITKLESNVNYFIKYK